MQRGTNQDKMLGKSHPNGGECIECLRPQRPPPVYLGKTPVGSERPEFRVCGAGLSAVNQAASVPRKVPAPRSRRKAD